MRWSRFLWLALPLLALAEVALRSFWASDQPADADLHAAADYVNDGYRGGDLVIVAPEWFASARAALGHQVLPLRDQARPDDETYERLWVVSAWGARAPLATGLELEVERSFGRVDVHLYRFSPTARVVFDFVEELDHARVSRVRDGSDLPCRRENDRWRCAERPGRDEWIGVETISDLDHHARRCIWAHPLPDGESLRITFVGVPRGDRIVGHAATDYVVGRHLGTETVDLAIEVDGNVQHRLTHRDVDGWQRFELDLGRGSARIDLTFVISATTHEGRHFCFQAQSRERR